jgi:6-phospho-beta-glucosidase
MKISILGCGLRTPLLLHGLFHSGLPLREIALHDIDLERAALMEALGHALHPPADVKLTTASAAEDAIQGCAFVISSIRVGNMQMRASDERLALERGFAGQETTGPAGFAMALRTVPVALEHARLVERLAPDAWIVNFTNPAGLITQAISTHTRAKVVGICDTPAELFHQIARVLGAPSEDVYCEYFGLNHLGWVRSVKLRGEEVIDSLLDDPARLRALYPVELFPPAFLQTLRLIPTEYLFYYYEQQLAVTNQRRAGSTRAEELSALNHTVLDSLTTAVRAGNGDAALSTYRAYLNRRNASYMKLDAAAESAFAGPDPNWDPFEGATGYHRIAVTTLQALTSTVGEPIVLNVPNKGSVTDLLWDDVLELPCLVDRNGPHALPVRPLPEAVKGLTVTVKQYERLTIQAARTRRPADAALALSVNPIVGNWNFAYDYVHNVKF